MKKIKKAFTSTNKFIKENFFVLCLALMGLWYLWPENNYSPYELGTQSYRDEAVAMSTDTAEEGMVSYAPRMAKMARGAIQPPIVEADGFEPEATERKVIKNGSLQLEVENTEEGKTLAQTEAEKLDALITHQNSWEVRRGVLAYNMTIRVPAENLEKLIENLAQLGNKKSENYSTSDITAAYNDTANQIKNLESRRDRLRELMEFNTDSLSDVLQVDRELSQVQNQIENLERTQKRRDTDVSFSTLNLTINPEPEIGDFSNPDWNLKRSWKQAVNDFIHDARDLVDKLIRALVYTPIWLPILLILWGIKRFLFGKKKKK